MFLNKGNFHIAAPSVGIHKLPSRPPLSGRYLRSEFGSSSVEHSAPPFVVLVTANIAAAATSF